MPRRLAFYLILTMAGCHAQEATRPVPSPTGTRPFRNLAGTRMGIGTAPAPIDMIQGEGDLGTADFGDTRQARFRLRNLLSKPIKLRISDKSCTCAAVHIVEPALTAGAETDIILSWTPRVDVLESSQVRLWAEIVEDQSQHRLRLEATGTIEPLLCVAYPRGPLDFGRLTPADLEQTSSQRVIELYSRQTAFAAPVCKFNLPGLEIVSSEAMPQDRLHALQARAGFRLVVRPTKLLSHGAFQAELQIQVDVRKQPLLIPLTGEYDTSTISLSQSRWQLPPRLSIKNGYKLPAVTLTVRFGTCTQCEVQQISPPLFTSTVTRTSDKTWRIEMQLITDESKLKQQFTPGVWESMLDQGFDQGSVILKLNHPDVPTITIPINGSQLFRD